MQMSTKGKQITNLFIILLAVVLICTSCDSKQQIYSNSTAAKADLLGESSAEGGTFTVYAPGGVDKLVVGQILDDNKKALSISDSTGLTVENITGSVKQLRFYYKIMNYSAAAKNIYFFLFIDGYLQPFKVDGEAKDGSDCSVDVAANADKYIGFTFDPVNLSENSQVSVVTYVSNTGAKDANLATSCILHFEADTADKSKYVAYKYTPNYIAKEYAYKGAASGFAKIGLPTGGDSDSPSIKSLIKNCKTNDQLCVLYMDSPSNSDRHLYLLIDNRLVKAFSGKYCLDIRQQEGKYYESAIDKSAMPARGSHTVEIIYPDSSYGGHYNISVT
jgi:hypothetical protein